MPIGLAKAAATREFGHALSHFAVAHDDDAPALPVPARRRETRRVEDVVESSVRHRLVHELATCKGGAHHVEEVHQAQASIGIRNEL
jgi:hypothetical protein